MRHNSESFEDILRSKMDCKSASRSSTPHPSFSENRPSSQEIFVHSETPSWIYSIPDTQRHRWQNHGRYRSASNAHSQSRDSSRLRENIVEKTEKEPQYRATDLSGDALASYLLLESYGLLKQVFTRKDLKNCFRKLAKEFHPDRNPNGTATYTQIREAYLKLADVIKFTGN